MSDVREPRNPSELRRALKIGRPNQHREVEIWNSKAVYSNRSGGDHVFDIDVHPESELVLRVHCGLPFLKVMRGTSTNVTVVFTSSWGNSLEIFPEQGARDEVPWHDTKVTLNGDGRDLVVQAHVREGKNRVGQFTHTNPDVIARVFETRRKGLA